MYDAKEMQKRLVKLTDDKDVESYVFTVKEKDYPIPEGVWTKEPDRIIWTDPASKFSCTIVRNPMGCLCGYVSVTESNLVYNQTYNEIEYKYAEVHGGLTYTEKDGDLWQLGFDCGHAMEDIIPAMLDVWKRVPNFPKERALFKDATYKDIGYVIKEIQRLASQLIKLEEGYYNENAG